MTPFSSTHHATDAHANLPGLPEIAWRSGDYSSFLERMRDLVHTLTLSLPDGSKEQPLAQMDTRLDAGRSGGKDFGLALMEAWAVICDVMAFYGERIANEAYIGTALEGRSIRELVNMIGYRPHPGLAAETWLSFFLAESKGAPTVSRIAAGTQVESVPGQDAEAQIFETVQDLEGRTAFNRFAPFLSQRSLGYPLREDSLQVRMAASPTRPTSGDPLLIVATRRADGMQKEVHRVRRITGVEAGKEQLILELAPAKAEAGRALLADPAVYTFGRSGNLFGYQAPLWDDVAPDTKRKVFPPEGGVYVGDTSGTRWRRTADLPEGGIRALLVTADGIFAAVPGAGLYRSQDEGRRWRQLRPAAAEVLSLASDDRGHLYAGTPDGLILRSKNGGDTWTAVRGQVSVTGRGAFAEAKNTTMPEIAVTSLFSVRGKVSISWLKRMESMLDISSLAGLLNPKNYVKFSSLVVKNSGKIAKAVYDLLKHMIAWLRDQVKKQLGTLRESAAAGGMSAEPDSGHLLFAGTEAGVYRSIPFGWEPANSGLPGYDEKTGSATVVVNGFARVAHYVVIATDQGLHRTDDFGNAWKPCNKGLPYSDGDSGKSSLKILTLASVATENDGVALLAGTAYGIFRSENAGTTWVSVNHDLPMRPADQGPAQLAVRRLALGQPDEEGHTRIFAATDNGLFAGSMAGTHWEPINRNLRQSRFRVLDEQYSEALDRGLLPPKLRVAFEKAGCGLTLFAYPIVEESGRAWTVPDEPRAGVYHLVKEGRRIKVCSRVTDIQAMAVGPSGALVVGTPPNDYTEDEWPHLWVEGNEVDLASRETEIVPDSLLLLVQDDLADYYTVREVSTVTRRDFTLRATVTRLKVDHTRNLARFDIRRTQAWFISKKRLPARALMPDLSPVAGTSLHITGSDHQLPTGRTVLVTGKRARARISRVGGLFSLDEGGGSLLGLSLRDPLTATTDSRGRVLVGTATGVWRYEDGAFVCLGLAEHAVDLLAVEHALDELYVHVPEGCEGYHLFRYRAGRWEPLKGPGRIDALAVRHTRKDDDYHAKGCIYLASGGVLRYSRDHGDRWELLGSGLEGRRVTSLAVDELRGHLYAGTALNGVYYLPLGSKRWVPIHAGMESLRVTTVYLCTETGTLYAGTHEGLFYTKDPAEPWQSMRRKLRVRHITAVLHHQGRLVVGTRGGAVFTLLDGDRDWYDHPWGISNDISALCLDAHGGIVVAARSHTLLTAQGAREACLQHGRLFQIRGAPQPAPESFRNLVEAPFRIAGIELGETAYLAVSPEEEDAWMIIDKNCRYLLYRDADALLVVHPAQAVKLEGPNIENGGQVLWHILTPAGTTVTLPAREGELIFEAAPEEDDLVGEPAVLADAAPVPDAGYSRLTFTEPLRHAYDRASVSVLGNVVRSTHGRTHTEILGSGDGAQANQRFRLRGQPLTHVQEDGAPRSTLRITVNPNDQGIGVAWMELPSLFQGEAARRGFVTRRDGHGRVNLIFGDGNDGARLPSGSDNIRAQYRIGIGKPGNIPPNSLTQLLAAPLGVRKVDNPLSAEGGLDPEPPSESRRKAPVTMRTNGRILSLRDLGDFLKLYPEVDHVTTRSIWNGYNMVGHVTLALRDNRPLERDSAYYRILRRTVNHNKPRTFGDVQMDGYVPLWFNISADLWIDGDLDRRRVEEDARALLLATFGYSTAEFGRQINVPDVTGLLRGMPGIQAVEVTRLYLEGTMPTLEESLLSPEAYWDMGRNQVVPARLLLVLPRGIRLTVTAPGGGTP